jgi:two-component system chemotaxis response regulator CheY
MKFLDDLMGNIMIADDSDAIRLVLKDILSIGDHNIVGEAKDGMETIDLYPQIKPDLLLLDLAMPKKDGLSVVKEIISQDPSAKIILITASDDQKIIQQCLDSGASSYISKPFDFNNVLKAISDILAK